MMLGLSQKFWVNIGGFQLAWWSAVLAGNTLWPLLLLLLCFHVYFHQDAAAEISVIILVGLLGFGIDTLLTAIRLFDFPSGSAFLLDSIVPPLWLLMLWFCFAATLRQGLSWFQGRWLLAAVVGGIAGPLSYYAGSQLGAMAFGFSLAISLLVMSLIWAVLLPLALFIAMSLSRNVAVRGN